MASCSTTMHIHIRIIKNGYMPMVIHLQQDCNGYIVNCSNWKGKKKFSKYFYITLPLAPLNNLILVLKF